jgi:hypothetical protein
MIPASFSDPFLAVLLVDPDPVEPESFGRIRIGIQSLPIRIRICPFQPNVKINYVTGYRILFF